MRDKDQKILEEAYTHIYAEEKITGERRQFLDDLISDYQSATDPNDDSDESYDDSVFILKTIRAEFGDKIADQVEDGSYIYHYGREYQKPYMSAMGKYGNTPRTTKKGTLNKQDVEPAKRRSKAGRRYTQGLNPNLP